MNPSSTAPTPLLSASALLRPSRGDQLRKADTSTVSTVMLRNGHHLDSARIPADAPRWVVRREIANARSIAVMLNQPNGAALTMEGSLALRGIETWLNVPDVHYWPAKPRTRTRVKRLSGFAIHGQQIPTSKARCLAGSRLLARTELVRGVRVVSIEEAMLDLARYAHPLQAWVGCTMALRELAPFDIWRPESSRSHASDVKRKLLADLATSGIVRNSVRARAIINGIDNGSQNHGEAALLWMLSTLLRSEAGPRGFLVPQAPIETDNGTYFADIGFPEIGLGLEMDGRSKLAMSPEAHGDWMDRQHAILRAGWDLVRIPYAALNEPEMLAGMLADELSRYGLQVQAPRGVRWKPVSNYLLDAERRF